MSVSKLIVMGVAFLGLSGCLAGYHPPVNGPAATFVKLEVASGKGWLDRRLLKIGPKLRECENAPGQGAPLRIMQRPFGFVSWNVAN